MGSTPTAFLYCAAVIVRLTGILNPLLIPKPDENIDGGVAAATSLSAFHAAHGCFRSCQSYFPHPAGVCAALLEKAFPHHLAAEAARDVVNLATLEVEGTDEVCGGLGHSTNRRLGGL